MKLVRRSILILPVNKPKFVEKAYLRDADAVMLDLEDAVPPDEKADARKLIRHSIPIVAKGGSEVLVRINNNPALFSDDVEASVYPGLAAIALPKTESAAMVHDLEALLERFEKERGVQTGSIKILVLIETPRGLLNAQEIALASSRIDSMSLGAEDYRLALGVEASHDGMEIFYPLSFMVTVCKAAGISPRGLLGSIAGFRDLEGFERAATRARQLGCEGAGCIHPDQVAILNKVFSPAPEKVAYARRVVEVFEEGLAKGTASVSLDGKMVDTPVYERAIQVVNQAEAIALVEKRKSKALSSISKKSGH